MRLAVDHVEQLHHRACLHPALPIGLFMEAPLDIAAIDVVVGSAQPVCDIPVNGTAVDDDHDFPAQEPTARLSSRAT